MSIKPEELRTAMRQWTSGVTIVSARADGQQHGMTVSSFMSVSLDPPMVLVSLANTTLTGDLLQRSGYFGITILSDDQQGLSDLFAGRVAGLDDRFNGLETFSLESGVPFPVVGLVNLDCKLVQTYPAGTTTLYLGEVVAIAQQEGGRPLVYFNRDYQELCE